jgi:hypothetical protein
VNFPGKLEEFKLVDLYSHFIKIWGFRNSKKCIILYYLVTWSKELREGYSNCLQMEWNLLFLLTCFGYFFLGVLSHVSLLTVALAVACVDGREVRALPC